MDHPNSDQLDVWPAWVEGIEYAPWGGRSPRGLTRVALSLIFKAQAEKNVSDVYVDPAQYDLWLTAKKAPRKYRGAPLLLEILERP